MKKNQNGFTLVELLTVIAIIGILASLLAPATHEMLGRARATQCASQLHQLGIAIQVYAQDNNQKFPSIEPLPSKPVDPDVPLKSLHDVLIKFVGNSEKVFHCPQDQVRWPVEGASYEWAYLYNDDLTDVPIVGSRARPPEKATVLWDYDNVHGNKGRRSKNVLFADGHVGGI
jgi:prepilin-type N-terminal cleavage/methylation domain-containing protein/prepilin-type processing-associated H-X9-DG protein